MNAIILIFYQSLRTLSLHRSANSIEYLDLQHFVAVMYWKMVDGVGLSPLNRILSQDVCQSHRMALVLHQPQGGTHPAPATGWHSSCTSHRMALVLHQPQDSTRPAPATGWHSSCTSHRVALVLHQPQDGTRPKCQNIFQM